MSDTGSRAFLTSLIREQLATGPDPGTLRADAACRGGDPAVVATRVRALDGESLSALAEAAGGALRLTAARLFPGSVALHGSPDPDLGRRLATQLSHGAWVAILELQPTSARPRLSSTAWDVLLRERDPVAAEVLGYLRGPRARMGLSGAVHADVASQVDAASLLPADADLATQGIDFLRHGHTYALIGADLATCQAAQQHLMNVLADTGWHVAANRIYSPTESVPFAGTEVPPRDPEPGPARTLYLERADTTLTLHAGSLQVNAGDQVITRIPLAEVGRVVTTTRVGLSSAVIHCLASNDIALTCLDHRGRRVARLVGPSHSSVHHLLAQVDASRDPGQSLPIARAIIDGKIAHQAVLAGRIARRQGDEAGPISAEMHRLRGGLPQATTTDMVMGIEGAASRAHFQFLATQLAPQWGFRARVRRPPTDPVNSMLSLGYTLLAAEAEAACHAAGLDPRIGMLHATGSNRPSLALDLMEEFRPLIIDTLVVNLANSSRIRPTDFDRRPGSPACWLSPGIRPIFFGAYERRMNQRSHQPGMGEVTYRQALHRQAANLALAILDPERPYRPLTWR